MLLEIPFPNINPIAFQLGPLKVHWYAIMYLIAFALGYWLMTRRLRHEPYRSISSPEPWSRTDVEDALLAAILGVIIGGRLGYVVFYNAGYYLEHPLKAFALWDGGMSFHGGAIGVALALAVMAWRKKRPFLQVTDFLVPAAPIGLAAGRIGNFINGELWGRVAPDWLPWAMRFPTGGDVLRHPSQIYQALGEGVALFVLLWLYARTPRYRGQVSGAFVFGYGVFRFAAEFFREPDANLGFLSLGLSMGQWLCVPMILGGAALWLWARRRGLSDVQDADVPASEPDPSAQDTLAADSAEGATTEDEPTSDGPVEAAETSDPADAPRETA